MMGPSRWRIIDLAARAAAALAVVACSAGDNRVDPGDLELRDLLGVAPDAANGWDAAQRAAARRVLVAGLRENDGPSRIAYDPSNATRDADGGDVAPLIDERVAAALAVRDVARSADGIGPLGVVRVAVGDHELALTARAALTSAAAVASAAPSAASAAVELWLAEAWDRERVWGNLPGRGLHVLSALAADAGHAGGPVIVVPAPRLAVIAAYIAPAGGPARLAVNPVLLAALEPDPNEPDATAALDRWSSPQALTGDHGARPPLAGLDAVASTGGNPYSFYGSVEECAFAQRTRCEACLPGSTCRPITSASNGNDECTMLAANAGRGYFLLCINLALAISSVDRCAGSTVPACARDPDAADALTTLENNADFLSDSSCAGGLDTCLAKIYGAPSDPYPGLGGGPTPTEPPRSTSVSCGDACSNKNSNCEASPSFNCSGASCNNSLTCNSECSSSNDQSGCGGNCNACTSSSSSGGGDSCGSSSSSSGNGCGSSSGGGGDSCGSSSSSSGNSCGNSSSCGSCSNSGGNSCNSGCSGNGGSKCSAARGDAGPGVALAMSMTWGILPVPFAALARRRARRRRPDVEGIGTDADPPVTPDPRASDTEAP